MTMDENCIFNTKVYIISRLISAQMGRRLPLAGENRIIINFEHIMVRSSTKMGIFSLYELGQNLTGC